VTTNEASSSSDKNEFSTHNYLTVEYSPQVVYNDEDLIELSYIELKCDRIYSSPVDNSLNANLIQSFIIYNIGLLELMTESRSNLAYRRRWCGVAQTLNYLLMNIRK
jgi:hypothetical protein